MNVVYFGNPSFSADVLNLLVKANINITAVVTNKDKKSGRGMQMFPSPVKLYSLKNNLKCIETEDFDQVLVEKLNNLKPDIFIVVAYRILPKLIFNIPKIGTINLHTSYLPKYRGPSPIQMTLLNGDDTAGITTFFIDSRVDTGKIILQNQFNIDDKIDFLKLCNKLIVRGSELLINTIHKILNEFPNIDLIDQDDSVASKAPKITKDDLVINLYDSAIDIHNRIRALSYIGVYCYFNSKKVFFYNSYFDNTIKLPVGEYSCGKDYLTIGTGMGALLVSKFKFEGKNYINHIDFYNSNQDRSKKFE